MKSLTYLKKMREKEYIVKKGFYIFQKIKKAFKQNISICVSQHPALGDAYLSGLYLKSCYGEKEFVVTALNSGSLQIYKYLNIKNVYMLSGEETESLIIFTQFTGISQETIRILHHQALAWHTGILWNLQGAYGLCFADLIEAAVFPGLKKSDRVYPSSKINENAKYIFRKLGLKEGKTFLIFPYSNTLQTPNQDFWTKLVYRLKQDGNIVATYTFENELPIQNTIELRVNIELLISVVQLAGYVVGIRSGLMDILSIAPCKKIILYPKYGAESWIYGSIKEYWSVNKFGYCNNAEEYEFETIQEEILW